MVWKLGILSRRNEIYGADIKASIILPVHNEVDRLESAVTRISEVMLNYSASFEIIIAEDGSTDGTDRRAAVLSGKLPFVKHIHGEKRLGRGRALKNAFERARGEYLVYMDADLATDLGQLIPLINAVEKEGYDIATGSRLLPESNVERSGSRHIASEVYNRLVRAILGSKLSDHQCGFKAFRRVPLLEILGWVSANHWFWDTELLVRAHRRNYRIKELPVKWRSGRETKVRLLKDSVDMFLQIVMLWWHLRVQQRWASLSSGE